MLRLNLALVGWSPRVAVSSKRFTLEHVGYTRSVCDTDCDGTQATHMKPDEVDHGVLCTNDKKKWEVPDHGVLSISFLQEPNAHRTIAEVRLTSSVGSAGIARVRMLF